MKTYIALISFFTLFLFFPFEKINAQKEKDSVPPFTKEWNINAFNLLIFQALDVSFEKYINDESSYGFSALVSLAGDDRLDNSAPFYYETAALSPFYRIYFGRRPNAGFFVEAFGSLSFGTSFDDSVISCSNSDSYNSFTEVGLGFTIGGKFITKKSYTLSIIVGAARNFISENGPGAMPRLGIIVGKRF